MLLVVHFCRTSSSMYPGTTPLLRLTTLSVNQATRKAAQSITCTRISLVSLHTRTSCAAMSSDSSALKCHGLRHHPYRAFGRANRTPDSSRLTTSSSTCRWDARSLNYMLQTILTGNLYKRAVIGADRYRSGWVHLQQGVGITHLQLTAAVCDTAQSRTCIPTVCCALHPGRTHSRRSAQ